MFLNLKEKNQQVSRLFFILVIIIIIINRGVCRMCRSRQGHQVAPPLGVAAGHFAGSEQWRRWRRRPWIELGAAGKNGSAAAGRRDVELGCLATVPRPSRYLDRMGQARPGKYNPSWWEASGSPRKHHLAVQCPLSTDQVETITIS